MAIMPMAWLMVKISPNTVMLMIVAMTGSAKVRTAALPVSIWESPVVYSRNGVSVESSPSSRE